MSTSGNPVNLEEEDDPHIGAVLLKMFLRDLPEPLLTFPGHSKILSMAGGCGYSVGGVALVCGKGLCVFNRCAWLMCTASDLCTMCMEILCC